MTHNQWDLTVRSKAQSSWNLNALLPKDLDFFILLSSLAGTYGPGGQSNYAAGCTFQDALARHRTSRGEKAVSLDIGWMRTIGIIAENEEYQKRREQAADMGHIEEDEFLAVLDLYCDPALPILAPSKSQLLVGVVTPVDMLSRSQEVPEILRRPLLSGFSHIGGVADISGSTMAVKPSTLFRQAESADERAKVVVEELVKKVARALSIPSDDVDPARPLFEYGVDSLVAVELRNWIMKEFAADVAVFDIMGGTKIVAIGDMVTNRTTIAKA